MQSSAGLCEHALPLGSAQSRLSPGSRDWLHGGGHKDGQQRGTGNVKPAEAEAGEGAGDFRISLPPL